jgi:hypothetical protein
MTAMPSFRLEPKASETQIQIIVNDKKIRRSGSGFPEKLQGRRPAPVHIGLRLCQDHVFFVSVPITDRAGGDDHPRRCFPEGSGQRFREGIENHKPDIVTAVRVLRPRVSKPDQDLQ